MRFYRKCCLSLIFCIITELFASCRFQMEDNFADYKITLKVGIFYLPILGIHLLFENRRNFTDKPITPNKDLSIRLYIGHTFTAWAQFWKSFPKLDRFLKNEKKSFKKSLMRFEFYSSYKSCKKHRSHPLNSFR